MNSFPVLISALLIAGSLIVHPAYSEELTVAVATNFSAPLESLASDFTRRTSHKLTQISASTGSLYAQIINGAPYDILLAADAQRPDLLDSGKQGASTPFTYAIGRLVFWSVRPDLFRSGQRPDFGSLMLRAVALANPRLAPYGLAARQSMDQLGLLELWQGKLVTGTNIGQAYAMLSSGNADAGFIALSQLISPELGEPAGSYWLVDPELYDPIVQKAIVLRRGAGNAAVDDFVRYLQSPPAQALIRQYGYLTD